LRDYGYGFAIIDVKARHIVSQQGYPAQSRRYDRLPILANKRKQKQRVVLRPHPISCSLIARKSIHNKLTDFHELMRDKAALRAFLCLLQKISFVIKTKGIFCFIF
jgi:hypothetical protein